MSAKADQLVSALLARGPWKHPQQLPAQFVPRLLARPWHSMDGWTAPWMKEAAQLMRSAAPMLLTEFMSLDQAGELKRETECLHNESDSKGLWRRYELNGPGVPKDNRGCALAAPVGCELLQRLTAIGVPV